ncbi:S-layer homology domain-containing protein [Bacillus sp. REN10]|uniref:S-layer homology domain-containing protein n=1 Tax=Bacillus sp. REN10 TaxID=2782541 RepID=UPI00193C84EC|nr:S-layer homology domain-containing protein [Bacillus sp. REN10]
MKKGFKSLLMAALAIMLFIPVTAPSAATFQGNLSGTSVYSDEEATFEAAASTTFRDVPSTYWAKKEIDFLVRKGIIQGYKNGKFGVNDPVTRWQAAVILARALGVDKQSAPNPGFRDVPASHPAYNAIAVLTNYGVFSKSTYFKPNDKLTRAQTAKILTESFGFSYASSTNFKDVRSNAWYYKYVQSLAYIGIARGDSKGNFLPNKVMNRAEYSAFIARALNPQFRLGVQATVTGTQLQSDGRLKMNVQLFNNTANEVFGIQGKYELHINDTLVAKSTSFREYKNVILKPKQKKTVAFYFSPSEVKQRINFNNTAELLFEHQWYFYQ